MSFVRRIQDSCTTILKLNIRTNIRRIFQNIFSRQELFLVKMLKQLFEKSFLYLGKYRKLRVRDSDALFLVYNGKTVFDESWTRVHYFEDIKISSWNTDKIMMYDTKCNVQEYCFDVYTFSSRRI